VPAGNGSPADWALVVRRARQDNGIDWTVRNSLTGFPGGAEKRVCFDVKDGSAVRLSSTGLVAWVGVVDSDSSTSETAGFPVTTSWTRRCTSWFATTRASTLWFGTNGAQDTDGRGYLVDNIRVESR
jgi:hypothetical protein